MAQSINPQYSVITRFLCFGFLTAAIVHTRGAHPYCESVCMRECVCVVYESVRMCECVCVVYESVRM